MASRSKRTRPDVVVFPRSTAHIAAGRAAGNEYDVPLLPRGAGTSLAGGCLPVGGGVMIVLTRMKRILEVNCAIVMPSSSRAWSMSG